MKKDDKILVLAITLSIGLIAAEIMLLGFLPV